MNNMAVRADGISAANLHSDPSNPQIDQCRETTIQNSRTQELGSWQSTFLDVRLQDHPSSSLQNGDLFSIRSSQLRTQAVQDPSVTTTERSVSLTLWPELTGINSISGYEQFHQCNSRLGIASEINLAPHKAREESQFYVVKEQLQSMVKSHLKSLSQDIELDNLDKFHEFLVVSGLLFGCIVGVFAFTMYQKCSNCVISSAAGPDTFKEIARSSTHTILAGCGLEHKRSEVQFMPPPSICTHGERMAAGQTSNERFLLILF
ncbi:hypothetical protein GH714_005837 [Hevea brasiliensis]|uniref:Uncharacterized protein n=1 Tax=Hevea brasiliensis TaxID=3981 RepID=A0A6A6KH97_HEVBR|nr:hypothetical protein GH714_005837 [Hevea brasiliensis]